MTAQLDGLARQLAGRARMPAADDEIAAAELALVSLGRLAESAAFAKAARLPKEVWLARGLVLAVQLRGLARLRHAEDRVLVLEGGSHVSPSEPDS